MANFTVLYNDILLEIFKFIDVDTRKQINKSIRKEAFDAFMCELRYHKTIYMNPEYIATCHNFWNKLYYVLILDSVELLEELMSTIPKQSISLTELINVYDNSEVIYGHICYLLIYYFDVVDARGIKCNNFLNELLKFDYMSIVGVGISNHYSSLGIKNNKEYELSDYRIRDGADYVSMRDIKELLKSKKTNPRYYQALKKFMNYYPFSATSELLDYIADNNLYSMNKSLICDPKFCEKHDIKDHKKFNINIHNHHILVKNFEYNRLLIPQKLTLSKTLMPSVVKLTDNTYKYINTLFIKKYYLPNNTFRLLRPASLNYNSIVSEKKIKELYNYTDDYELNSCIFIAFICGEKKVSEYTDLEKSYFEYFLTNKLEKVDHANLINVDIILLNAKLSGHVLTIRQYKCIYKLLNEGFFHSNRIFYEDHDEYTEFPKLYVTCNTGIYEIEHEDQ